MSGMFEELKELKWLSMICSYGAKMRNNTMQDYNRFCTCLTLQPQAIQRQMPNKASIHWPCTEDLKAITKMNSPKSKELQAWSRT